MSLHLKTYLKGYFTYTLFGTYSGPTPNSPFSRIIYDFEYLISTKIEILGPQNGQNCK